MVIGSIPIWRAAKRREPIMETKRHLDANVGASQDEPEKRRCHTGSCIVTTASPSGLAVHLAAVPID